jgi:hypothetical protein
VTRILLAMAMLLGLSAAAMAPAIAQSGARYAKGQVWEFRARPGDEGALIRIQRIEAPKGAGAIYHISMIGVHLFGQAVPTEIQHMRVTQAVLDASVTRLSDSRAVFPSADQGIAEWRAANGGVFTIPLAEIVALVGRTRPPQPDPPAATPTT